MIKKDVLCPLPWIHFSTNTDTSVRVCCNTDNGGFVRKENGDKVYTSEGMSLNEIFNLPFYRQIRKQMINGEKPDICRKCYSLEDSGVRSMRQIYQAQYQNIMGELIPKTHEDGSIEPNVLYLDFSLSNKCNIKCRMCNPSSSSLLAEDFEKAEISYDKNFYSRAKNGWLLNDSYKQLIADLLPTIKKVLVTGGEPFLAEMHYYILEQAISLGQAHEITLSYHTNLTVVPDKLIECWRHFKAIELHASIEAFGELNEYVRFPSRWHQVDRNFRKLISLKEELPLWIEVHTCLQAYSLTKLPQLLKYLLEFQDKIPAFPYLIWLDMPSFLKASVLPKELKQKAIEEITQFIDEHQEEYFKGPFLEFNKDKYNMFQGYQQLLLSEDLSHLLPDFFDYTEKLDEIRSQSIFNYLPELKSVRYALDAIRKTSHEEILP